MVPMAALHKKKKDSKRAGVWGAYGEVACEIVGGGSDTVIRILS
jgi:hypothetical protein